MQHTEPPPGIKNAQAQSADDKNARWNGRLSITITLAAAIGLLTLISAGGVLSVGVWVAQKNTFSLLNRNANLSLTAAVDRIKQHLQPAENQVRYIANRFISGQADLSNRQQLVDLLTGTLAAAPQVEIAMYVTPALQSTYVVYDRVKDEVRNGTIDNSAEPAIRHAMDRLRSGSVWGPPIWRPDQNKTFINAAAPIYVNGDFKGAIVAVVSVNALSRFLANAASLGGDELTSGERFILYGHDRVLAHYLMANGYPGRTNEAPLPALASFNDPVLAAIWRKDLTLRTGLKLPDGTGAHRLKFKDTNYLFVYSEIEGYGPEPMIAGLYFREADIGAEVRRMVVAIGAGIGALLLSLLAAVYLGRKIAQPIVRFSNAASRIRELDLADVHDLPASVFRELNDQSDAFNAMLKGLRWFEQYVPRKLVARLVQNEGADLIPSRDRNITVMFTDIVDFSSMSQDMSAAEVAELVNHHFALIGKCIDAEEGTIDKFMGDAVMAFWGAPEKQKQRACRACRAALDIAAAIRADNERRAAQGLPPIHVRIGIHTGTMTVGNIGAPGHINYTIIGDAVNVGQRLEQLAKEIYPPDQEVAIVISGDTARELDGSFSPVPAGSFELKGRDGAVPVFKLA